MERRGGADAETLDAFTVSEIIAAELQNSTFFHTRWYSSAEFEIKGYHDPGRLRHALSQERT